MDHSYDVSDQVYELPHLSTTLKRVFQTQTSLWLWHIRNQPDVRCLHLLISEETHMCLAHTLGNKSMWKGLIGLHRVPKCCFCSEGSLCDLLLSPWVRLALFHYKGAMGSYFICLLGCSEWRSFEALCLINVLGLREDVELCKRFWQMDHVLFFYGGNQFLWDSWVLIFKHLYYPVNLRRAFLWRRWEKSLF